MTRRHRAYFETLKYYFQLQLLEGVEPRRAYRNAKNAAATYVFRITTTHLNFITV